MPLTVQDKINIAKISQYLSLVDVGRSGIFGKRLDQELPYKIYMERYASAWKYYYEFQEPITPVTQRIFDYTFDITFN